MAYTTKEIMELMERAARLGVNLEITDQDYTLKIRGKAKKAAAAPQMEAAPQAAAACACPPQEKAGMAPEGRAVKAPLVGTFYAAPAPDQAPFVRPGQPVKKGDVLFIIESMKLMNEVQSERDGVVGEILVNSGDLVEYGQPILTLE